MQSGTPTDPNAPPAPDKQRGFLIEAACVTPYQSGASLVLDTFVKNLAARKVASMTTPPALYSIEKVTVSWTGTYTAEYQQGATPVPTPSAPAVSPFRDPRDMGRGRSRGRDPRSNLGRAAPPPPPSFMPSPVFTPTPSATTSPTDQFDPMKDPATGEDMSKDVKVLVRMVVVLDPKPQQPAAPAAAPTVAQANP